ncbi:uncharacterized protein LOC125315529 [Rhodamnia argentea]|uniref:Uncharacterized protein LOC125315529 n=1 Tax=Rhodamnia argentea TaxID=178133 RepID=A0ABM3HJA0_9MYRT|nr:uncharacterized protein LOC125315529 [Rhodamnia argentea]
MEEIIDVQEEELEEVAAADTLEFPLLTSLSLEEMPNLKTFSYGKYCIHCPSLIRPTIFGCPKMITFSSFEGKQRSMTGDIGLQQAFSCINSDFSLPVFFNEKVHFPNLEELELSSMCELKRIWPNQLHGPSFSKLESITVGRCENLLHVFPSNSVDRLHSLNKIEVVECPSLEALFEPISLSDEKRRKPLVLSALKKMKLMNLPRMRDILKSDFKVTLAFRSPVEVDVSHCHSLPYLFSSAMARTLDKLGVLDVSCCNNLRGIIAMEEGKGNDVETLKFRHLSTLKLGYLEKLISFSLASCAGEGLHPLFDEKVFQPLEQLTIGREDEDVVMRQSYMFDNLKELCLSCYHDQNVSFPSNFLLQRFPNLETLDVDCSSFEEIFPGDAFGHGGATSHGELIKMEKPLRALKNLKRLGLNELWYLRQNVSFPSNFLLQRFPNLETLDVDCSSFEEIFPGDAFGHGGATSHGELIEMEKPLRALKNLKRLGLNELWYLRQVWKDGSSMAEILKQIEVLSIFRCPSLSIIFPSPTSFHSLTNLQVEHCVVLVHLGTCSAVTSLVHLTHLILRDCGAIKDVITDDGNGAEEISFPKLEELILDRLPSLESFSSTNCAFRFPSLVRIVVKQCP